MKKQHAMRLFREWYTNATPHDKISMMSEKMSECLAIEIVNMYDAINEAHLFNGHVDVVSKDFAHEYIVKNYETGH
jgi:hypothetical protein